MSEITVTLPAETAERLERLMRERAIATPEQAIGEALAAFEDEADAGADVEAWLQEVVAARCEAVASDPSNVMSAADVRARLFPSD